MARQYTLHRSAGSNSPRINYAAELNPQQAAAVTSPPGAALVIAGAGSGKTRTLTYRVAYLLENGVLPQNILLLTFTNKAARSMIERVAALLPNDVSGLWSGTFHSVGNRILRRDPQLAGFSSGFSIMDREDQEDLIRGVIVQLGFDPKDKRFPKAEVLANVFSYSLNTGVSIEAVLEEKYPHFIDQSASISSTQRHYETQKKVANAVDFDDLLEKPLLLLQSHPELAAHYQSQFQFILVDEYQDTNLIQANFIDILAKQHGNLMVVGDDAQSIYSWRGANFQNILDFTKRYPLAKTYKIETNYRSVPDILQVANASIAVNLKQFPKSLVSIRETATVKPAFVTLFKSSQQATFVAQRISELAENGIPLSEIAVLYRSHYHSMEVQMELTRNAIPFQITSGLRFFEQAHIKDVAAFLKFTVNPRDEVAFKRIIRLLPGIGIQTADRLWDQLQRHIPTSTPAINPEIQLTTPSPNLDFRELLLKVTPPPKIAKHWQQLADTFAEIAPGGIPAPPSEMIRSVIEAVYDDYAKAEFANYDARKDDLNTLANFASQYASTAELLEQLALLSNLDQEEKSPTQKARDPEQVTLSSIHQSKGLEWQAVFVITLAEGMFPSARSIESEESLEEERRLFYVAVTRAKDELYLTYPEMRQSAHYGDSFNLPSRFLNEVPQELLESWQINRGF